MKLKEIRTQKNLTQEQLANMSGVDQSTISLYEKVPCEKRPSWETVARLAKALDVRPEELFPIDNDSAA